MSKGGDDILKIMGGVAFYVKRFYEKKYIYIYLVLAINRRIFAYSMSLMGISQKLFLTILLHNYYSQIMIFIKTLNIKRYSSHNFQDIVTSFGHKVDRTIYMLTRYRFFDKCVLRGFIDKIPFF